MMKYANWATITTHIRRTSSLASLAAFSIACVALWPLVSLFHEMIVVAAANLLSYAARLPLVVTLLEIAPVDRVYTSVAISTIGNITALGVAVQPPLGVRLHEFLPQLFAEPELVVGGAWTSAVIASGSSLVARLLAEALSGAALVFVGICLVYWGLRSRRVSPSVYGLSARTMLLLLGILLMVRVATIISTLSVSHRDLEVMGLALVLTKLLDLTPDSYSALQTVLRPMLSPLVPVAILGSIFAVDLSILQFSLLLRSRLVKGRSSHLLTPEYVNQTGLPSQSASFSRRLRLSAMSIGPLMALLVLAVIGQDFALARTNYAYQAELETEVYGKSIVDNPTELGISAPWRDASMPPPTATPVAPRRSVVKIVGRNYQYAYTVDGRTESIRGIGYNVMYSGLGLEQRAQLYDRDFRKMRDMGINTILGWNRDEFDELTLAKASQYGLGVILPYHLPPEGDYTDETFRKALENDVVGWVKRYKDNPALRMWGLGNEVLHDIREHRQGKPFGEFYRGLADTVHEIDPDHPIVYREAEDVFVPSIKKAVTRDDSEHPWFVYGINIFTYRLSKVLSSWSDQTFDVPLIVSELGPTGLGPRDRPGAYVKMWSMMRNHQSNVLGGFLYVWTTAGPEPLDRVFGLVDSNGVPTDGTVEAMATKFAQEMQLEQEAASLALKPGS